MFNSQTGNFSFLAQSKEVKEWVAPESNNTDNHVPRMKQMNLTMLSNCEASAPLMEKTLHIVIILLDLKMFLKRRVKHQVFEILG